eukprot:1221305-Prymnesium_polylepis.2
MRHAYRTSSHDHISSAADTEAQPKRPGPHPLERQTHSSTQAALSSCTHSRPACTSTEQVRSGVRAEGDADVCAFAAATHHVA